MFLKKILSRIYCVNKNYSCHLHVVSSNSAVSLQQQDYVNIVLMLIERPVGFCPSLTISKASTHSMASRPAGRPRPRQPHQGGDQGDCCLSPAQEAAAGQVQGQGAGGCRWWPGECRLQGQDRGAGGRGQGGRGGGEWPL